MFRFGASIFVFLSLFFAFSANASIILNEIMYDLEGADEGREWVELYNSGLEPVDISNFRFFENDTNHKMVNVNGGSTVPASGYALVVDDFTKFKNDWPEYGGIIFESTFSLKNSGEYLALKDGAGSIVDEVTYPASLGGGGDGNTLQKINGVWRVSRASPGLENFLVSAEKIQTQNINEVKNPKEASSQPSALSIGGTQDLKLDEFMLEHEKDFSKNFNSTSADTADESTISDFADSESKNKGNVYWLVLAGVVSLASVAVLAIRRRGRESLPGDDFEILEE